jgi:hypothetical protein
MLVVERLDQLPLHLADHGDRSAPGALDRLAELAQVLHPPRFELVDVPRADPVVVDVRPHRGFEVAHDDRDLHRLGEERFALRLRLDERMVSGQRPVAAPRSRPNPREGPRERGPVLP